jgi:hypothetical protein
LEHFEFSGSSDCTPREKGGIVEKKAGGNGSAFNDERDGIVLFAQDAFAGKTETGVPFESTDSTCRMNKELELVNGKAPEDVAKHLIKIGKKWGSAVPTNWLVASAVVCGKKFSSNPQLQEELRAVLLEQINDALVQRVSAPSSVLEALLAGRMIGDDCSKLKGLYLKWTKHGEAEFLLKWANDVHFEFYYGKFASLFGDVMCVICCPEVTQALERKARVEQQLEKWVRADPAKSEERLRMLKNGAGAKERINIWAACELQNMLERIGQRLDSNPGAAKDMRKSAAPEKPVAQERMKIASG